MTKSVARPDLENLYTLIKRTVLVVFREGI